ncbi:MAG: hypothetical protein K2X93_28725 [Candidatus Obscuribacterales bacterium]|nr:hypothetical protein [Candidatus Obscuribacterales bacterium]
MNTVFLSASKSYYSAKATSAATTAQAAQNQRVNDPLAASKHEHAAIPVEVLSNLGCLKEVEERLVALRAEVYLEGVDADLLRAHRSGVCPSARPSVRDEYEDLHACSFQLIIDWERLTGTGPSFDVA